MAESDGHRACEEAAAYYHDLLLDPGDPSVPRSVTNHVRRCAYCRGQVERLGQMLAEAEAGDGLCQPQPDTDLVSHLSRHFACLGDEVGCRQVKPLLPTLLPASLRPRIPTPVTVHVDHCAECQRDLAALERLSLGEDQLARLGRLYAESLEGASRTCQKDQARATIPESGSLQDGGPDALMPSCVCRACRDAAYERRRRLLDQRRRDGSGAADSCDREVSMADLFDYALPDRQAGANAGRTGAGRDGFAAHLYSCSPCLSKLQALHRAIYGILDRADSNVVTVYTTQPVEQEADTPAQAGYAGHPVHVQVTGLEPEPAAAIGGRPTAARAILAYAAASRVLRPFAKTAFLAAAMIPLVVFFWWSTRSASGLSGRQISELLAGAPVVHIQTFHPDTSGDEPTVDLWASAETIIWKSPAEHAIYDLVNKRRFDLRAGTGAVWVAADRTTLGRIKAMVAAEFDVPKPDARLERIEADTVGVTSGAVEVYELSWEEMDPRGDPIPRRWTVSLDPVSGRPLTTEFFDEAMGETFRVIKQFSYPEANELAERVRTLLASR